MDMIDCIRIGLLIFDYVGLLVLAVHPTRQNLAEYETWIGYYDKEFRAPQD